MRRWQAGFNRTDLIVLIVIVIVIALFVLAILPPLPAAHSEARRANCMSNLQQISRAISAYYTNYNDYWPFYSSGGNPDYRATDSLTLLYPEYTGNLHIFSCPSTHDRSIISIKTRSPKSGPGQVAGKPQRLFTWFGENPLSSWTWIPGLEPAGGRAYSSPEWCSYGYDDAIAPRGPSSLVVAGDMDETAVTGNSTTANHPGGCNFLYFDGHTSFQRKNYASDNPLDNVFKAEGGSWSPDTDSYLRRP